MPQHSNAGQEQTYLILHTKRFDDVAFQSVFAVDATGDMQGRSASVELLFKS